MPFEDFYFFFQVFNFIFKMFFGRFTFVKKGALVAKFTSGKLAKIPADPGVPHEASLGLAGEAGAGVDDMLLLAGRDKLTVAIVMKFAHIFQGCHFYFFYFWNHSWSKSAQDKLL